MRTYDLTPLFRSSVGFDRVSRLMESAMKLDDVNRSYPPYNIVRLDDTNYRITLAVAGFAEDDLEVELHNNRLTVSGNTEAGDDGVEYLHRGIAGRSFERSFQLTDHIEVKGATTDRGLLHISLERRVPDALKPRLIQIGAVEEAAAAK